MPPTGEKGQLTAETVAAWSFEQLFEHVRAKALPESLTWISQQHAIATKFGLALIAYEGGQHLVGVAGGENNADMTRLFHEANADPRMGKLYDDYLAGWVAAGGGLFANFSSVGSWSKWGSWGLLQFSDDNELNSPKYMAVMRWAAGMGQNVALPEVP